MLLWIALGGAVGSALRYLVGGFVQRFAGSGFPAGTMTVNIAGCFLMGILMHHFMNNQSAHAMRGLLMIGFCGGFTTFSAFSAEIVGLSLGGELARASVYAILSMTLSILATAAGLTLARALPA